MPVNERAKVKWSRCRCEASDARVCWAIRNPEAYHAMDVNPKCGCECHKENGGGDVEPIHTKAA